jgi:uncharacterized protein (TIGR00255 family)
MIQSMTGYGKAIAQLPSKKITVEIKSLNSKNLDLNTRVPSTYREKELIMRDRLAKSLVRGKVDFNLYIESIGEATTARLNEPVIKEYMRQLQNISDGDEVELLKMAVRMPDTLKTEREEVDQAEFQVIIDAVDNALIAINKYRTDEGKVLEDDFLKRSEKIAALLEEVIEIDPQRMENVKERLYKAVKELKETVYYLEKYDITEEKVRLTTHLNYFNENIHSSDSNGKKLGFITQEIGREINTIGSKANFAPMQQLVVQMKDELEKIKEQALNVL